MILNKTMIYNKKQDSEELQLQYAKCKRCNHQWLPRVPRPTICPKCKCYTWNLDKNEKKDSDK